MAQQRRRRPAMSEAHARLGAELRRIREQAHTTTRDLGNYSSGHISNVESGYVTPSKDLITLYARLGGDLPRLLTMLGDARDEGSKKRHPATEAGDALVSRLLNPDADMMELRQGFRIESYENSVLYGPDRIPQTVILTARIRPTVDQARYFAYRCTYEDDPRRGAMTVDTVAGCQLIRVHESDRGILDIVTDFRENSVRTEDGAYEVTLQSRVHSDRVVSPQLLLGFISPLPRCVATVKFDERSAPAKIWWMRSTVPYVNEPEPHQVFEPNPAQHYSREFLDLKNEYCGVIWEWMDGPN